MLGTSAERMQFSVQRSLWMCHNPSHILCHTVHIHVWCNSVSWAACGKLCVFWNKLYCIFGHTARYHCRVQQQVEVSKLLLKAFARSIVSGRSLATRGELVLFWRQLLPMNELKLHVGGLYFVDKAIVMTTFKIIFDFTVSLLILH